MSVVCAYDDSAGAFRPRSWSRRTRWRIAGGETRDARRARAHFPPARPPAAPAARSVAASTDCALLTLGADTAHQQQRASSTRTTTERVLPPAMVQPATAQRLVLERSTGHRRHHTCDDGTLPLHTSMHTSATVEAVRGAPLHARVCVAPAAPPAARRRLSSSLAATALRDVNGTFARLGTTRAGSIGGSC